MRLLYTIKYFFKGFKSNILLNLVYFLVLPIVMTLFMSTVLDTEFRSPIVIEVSPIFITDNDKSDLSKSLISFIESDLKNLFNVKSDKGDANLEVIIPKGYEDNIISNKSVTIDLVPLETRRSTGELMQNILDNYHEQVYLSSLNTDNDLNELFSKSSLSTSFIEPYKQKSSTEYFAVSMLGYLIFFFTMSNVQSGYLSDSNGFSKRFHSMPIKRTTLLVYDSIVLWIYSFVILLLYIFANRILKIAFLENLLPIIFICMIVSVFIACASNFISVFLPKKVGLPLISILTVIQVIAGGVFFPIDNVVIQKLSPLYFITELFNNYHSIDFSNSSIFICLGASMVLFLASFIKEKYSWREF